MRIKVADVTYQASGAPNLAQFEQDIPAWFASQSAVGPQSWLLAHMENGVIWGKIVDQQLVLSSSLFPDVSPPLDAFTLWEARLFGENAEVRVWRSASGFEACRIEDRTKEEATAFDESHHLWGTAAVKQKGAFILLADGQQGLQHAVPCSIEPRYFRSRELYRPVVLRTRHYLDFDEDGRATIVASRLVALSLAQRRQRMERIHESA